MYCVQAGRHSTAIFGQISAEPGTAWQGDAFLVVFSRAGDALATAVAAQQALTHHNWPAHAPLLVRMGLRPGEPLRREIGYVGVLAARDLPSEVTLLNLGTHRLKDLQQPEHLFQVVHPDLPSDFPPLRSLDARPNNLPIQLTSFIGRTRDIAEVKGLLGAARLVTLTGSWWGGEDQARAPDGRRRGRKANGTGCGSWNSRRSRTRPLSPRRSHPP